MDVYEAVTSRRAVRGFTDRPVPIEALERVLSAAAWAPSGSNIQPWRVYVLTGEPLAELKKRAGERLAAGDPWDEREYEMYPAELKSPYRERRSAFGRERYGALGIARDDWEARQRAAAENWQCFGAPVALFLYIDRDMGPPQWADVGIYLQTVMLLLRAEGLHSCPQMAWSVYRKTVAEIVNPPDELILFCGMSIGFEDVTMDYVRTGRAPLDDTVTFVEGSSPAIACGVTGASPAWSGSRRSGPATPSTGRAPHRSRYRTPLPRSIHEYTEIANERIRSSGLTGPWSTRPSRSMVPAKGTDSAGDRLPMKGSPTISQRTSPPSYTRRHTGASGPPQCRDHLLTTLGTLTFAGS
ncbi:nitroreductase [Nonomuraea sp. 3N208]|uniref:nitroreductase n=1 Tax=Nonomuraea sp. 3N208 TaxID=3457421 RepID=UPI003FCF5DE7